MPAPGRPSQVLVSLEAGSYAILCFVESGDRVPHLAKGMIRELAVVAGTAPKEPEPKADARMVLLDYEFGMTRSLTAGRRTIKVETRGPQLHEVEFVRLQPGKTVADVLAWLKTKAGPPPGEPYGGTAALQAAK